MADVARGRKAMDTFSTKPTAVHLAILGKVSISDYSPSTPKLTSLYTKGHHSLYRVQSAPHMLFIPEPFDFCRVLL